MSVIVKRTGKDDLSLSDGTKLLGEASTQTRRKESEWREYRLWQTPEGKFIAGKAALSKIAFVLDDSRHEAEEFTDRKEVMEYFGLDKTAKYLYELVGWRPREQMA